jgi:hypothetical protein
VGVRGSGQVHRRRPGAHRGAARTARLRHHLVPENGIRISDAGDEFNCGLDSDRQKYTCQFRNSKRGRYKYTINIVGGPNKIEALDPFIMN